MAVAVAIRPDTDKNSPRRCVSIEKEGSGVNYSNPIKEKLRAGETVIGCFIPPPSPEWVEIIALAGFDFALLDAEHGPISPETAYPMILAAEANGIPAIARVGQKDKQVILKFLDLGISGVMFPQVNNAQEAEEAVAATKYFPRGTRGLAGSRTFEYGLTRPAAELVPLINERTMTIVQFEHIDTLAELDAIMDVPDMDVLFVGPNDLAQSMGYAGQPMHPDVTAIGDQVVARAKERNIKLGTVAPDGAAARRAIERGFDMIVANAPVLLAQSARRMITEIRG
jgi:4-hydroxy-2-oxoheptanedioate aldolase